MIYSVLNNLCACPTMGDHAFEAGLVGWRFLYRAIDTGDLKAKLWLFDGASAVYAGCAGATSSSAVEWGRSRPCCTDQGCKRNDPDPVLGSCDADGLRASQLQHAVQDRDADVHLGGLTL